jgi:hypothetical protein
MTKADLNTPQLNARRLSGILPCWFFIASMQPDVLLELERRHSVVTIAVEWYTCIRSE